jgi:hypothetical protein
MGLNNTEWAIKQGGDTVILASLSQQDAEYPAKDLRFAWSLPSAVTYFDHFLGDTLRAEWVNTANNSGTIAANGGQGGTVRFTTGAADTNYATLALGTHWKVSNGFTVFTARVASISAVATRSIEIGLTDATTETNGLVFSQHGSSPTAVADNAAIFAYDTGATPALNFWATLAVNATTVKTRTVTTSAPVAGTYQRFDIVINSSGDAFYYIDGTLVDTIATAVATSALLTPWIGVVTRTAGASIIDADYQGTHGPLA